MSSKIPAMPRKEYESRKIVLNLKAEEVILRVKY
jgi:hypothetical protein